MMIYQIIIPIYYDIQICNIPSRVLYHCLQSPLLDFVNLVVAFVILHIDVYYDYPDSKVHGAIMRPT